MTIEQQQIIPAISNFKALRNFLKTSIEYCVLMDFQLAELEDVVKDLKDNDKKVLIHIDLIKGLSPNEFGAIYLIQKLNVDGIISTKPQPIIVAKKRKKLAIQRIFLKDSLSLSKSLDVVNKINPDYLEVLPAISNPIITKIMEKTNQKVLCGGLVQSIDQIKRCIDLGAIGVTTSTIEFWK